MLSIPQEAAEQRFLISPAIINGTLPNHVTVFASGMNRLADLNAGMIARVPLGVDVSRISKAVIEKICAGDIPVLLDSGAFGEVAIRNGHVSVVHAISEREWTRRLAVYLRIAKALCPKNVSVIAVAPDRVGSQEITLKRLSHYRNEVRQLSAAGATILVPLQCGQLSFADFFLKAKDVLGVEVLPGLPMNKAAASCDAVVEFVQSTSVTQVHFLGMGAANRKARPLIRVLQQMCPNLRISMDANSIRAAVGARRNVTLNEAAFADEMSSSWSGEVDLRQWGGKIFDMTELLYTPSCWLSPGGLKDLADSLPWLSQLQRKDLIADPDNFLNADRNQNGWIDEALMEAYFNHVKQNCRQGARTRAVLEHLERSLIAHQV